MIASLQLQVEAPTKIQVLSSLGLDADLETRELAQLGSLDFFFNELSSYYARLVNKPTRANL